MAAKGARAAAPKVAAMATRANADGATPSPGAAWARSWPASAPKHELMMRIGARVPPEVPEPRAIHQITSLPTTSARSVAMARRPATASSMTS